jgi:glycosyltransferase involved in cell wall biosynthesis
VKTIHVLIVARHLVGGVRTYLDYVYSCFDPGRYRLTVLAPAQGEQDILEPRLEPFQTAWITVPGRRAIPELALSVRRIVGRDSVDLIHSQGTSAALACVLGTVGCRTPHLATLHETFYPEQFQGISGRAKRLALGAVLARADVVNLVSDDARQNLLRELPRVGSRAASLLVIRNGIRTSEFEVVARERATRLEGPEPTLGYLGRFMPEKGFQVLIDAVEQIANTRSTLFFHVSAGNYGAYIREYQSEIRQRGLERYFEFPGLAASAVEMLRRVDAIVVPSLREASPLVPMEAMTAGCPLIASDCIGLREITRDTPAISVSAGDARALASAICTFLDHRDAFSRDALAFAPSAAARFDVRRTSAMLERNFERLLTANPSRGSHGGGVGTPCDPRVR